MVLSRLLEVLFIEALRSGTEIGASPGLMRGLGDDRLAAAIRRIHEDPRRAWTIADLAKAAALSRSAFFARFTGAVGMAPMEYLLAWRMALGKSLLRRNESVSKVAVQVGYGSASAFSVAFTRHVGVPPARYAKGAVAAGIEELQVATDLNAS
jgi:AraC-like DNA-binding protein